MSFEDLRNTSLSLSLFSQPKKQYFQLDHHQKNDLIYPDQFTSLSLALSSDQVTSKSSLTFDASKVHGDDMVLMNRQASSISVISSISSSVKRDRDEINIVNQTKPNISSTSHSEETGSRELGEIRIESKATSDDQNIEEEEEGGPRKKLRLSQQQSLILEDNFKEHITLNPVIHLHSCLNLLIILHELFNFRVLYRK